jgi:hypothetical protein
MYAMKAFYKAPGPASNKYWYTKILFKIDITVQLFLKECGKARKFQNVRFEELRSRLNAIRTGVEGGDISVGLPPQFVEKNAPNRVLYRSDIDGSGERTGPKPPAERAQRNHQHQHQQHNTPNNQNRAQNQQQRQVHTSPLINNTMSKEWQSLTQSFQVASYLSKNDQTNQAPAYNGKTFCIMFHVVGRCKRGYDCPY